MGWSRPPESVTSPPAPTPGTARPGSPVLVRYADDLVALCHSRDQADRSRRGWPRGWRPGVGLQRGQDRDRASRRRGGLSGVQRPPLPRQATDQTQQGGGETHPGPADHRDESLRGHNAQMVLIRLNPIVRGWSAYYRHAMSARVFNELDTMCGGSPTSGRISPIRTSRSTGSPPGTSVRSTRSRRDQWVFGDRDSGAWALPVPVTIVLT